MPSYIVKPKRDEDFYVNYSEVVDSPGGFGTRAEWLADGVDPARLDRADAYGTSALWGNPPYLGWTCATIQVREGVVDPTRPGGAWWGEIARADLRAFCETLGDDGNFHPPAGMVRWETGDDPEGGEQHG